MRQKTSQISSLLLLLVANASVDRAHSFRGSLNPSIHEKRNPIRYSSTNGYPLTVLFSSRSAPPEEGIRLNKVFKATHSRREADALIESGRVSVNGQPVEERGGFKVIPFVDEVSLDGGLIEGWEAMNGIEDPNKRRTNPAEAAKTSSRRENQNPGHNTQQISTQNFEYIKYYKPRGVTCTTDRTIKSNIIDDLLHQRGYQPKHRVYPVGRLDKDTSGLILLTSDGRLPNSALRGQFKQPKVYKVWVDKPLPEHDLQKLREGVVITTTAQREGRNRGKSMTAPTLPCQVERIPQSQQQQQQGLTITLVEGRNRQIRKMMQALGYEVVKLHRVQFMGITLDPLRRAGEWVDLDQGEMQLVQDVLERAATPAVLEQ